MVRLDARTRRAGELTLVEGRLHNGESESVRVTVETPLSPVYPPRADGRPVRGWRPSEGRTTLLLAADQCVGVGFATPAAPEEPALRVVTTDRDPATDGGIVPSPDGVVSALGDPLPPAAVGRSTSATPTAMGSTEKRRGARDHGQSPERTHAEVRRLRRAAEGVATRAAAVERRLERER